MFERPLFTAFGAAVFLDDVIGGVALVLFIFVACAIAFGLGGIFGETI